MEYLDWMQDKEKIEAIRKRIARYEEERREVELVEEYVTEVMIDIKKIIDSKGLRRKDFEKGFGLHERFTLKSNQ